MLALPVNAVISAISSHLVQYPLNPLQSAQPLDGQIPPVDTPASGVEVSTMALPLLTFYRNLTGLVPQEQHRDFYESGAQGYNTRDIEDDKVRTVLVKALHMAIATNSSVVITTPKSLEKNTLQEISKHARQFVRRFKGKDDQVKLIVAAIKRLRIASRLLSPNGQPSQWVTIGYCDTDPVPEWLREKLWTTTKT
jgi:hypothetical protein